MWQEAAKHVQGTKLGQNERSFECKSGNVKSYLSEARCLLGGGLPSPAGLGGRPHLLWFL